MADDPQRAALHFAVGTYAAWMVGIDTADQLAAAEAAVPPDQRAEYDEMTAYVREQVSNRGLHVRTRDQEQETSDG